MVFLQPVELAGLGEAALGVGHAGDRAVLGEGLRRFGDQRAAIRGMARGDIDGHAAAHAVAERDKGTDVQRVAQAGEITVRFLFDEPRTSVAGLGSDKPKPSRS